MITTPNDQLPRGLNSIPAFPRIVHIRTNADAGIPDWRASMV
jgi:hypothetical protein